MNSTIQYWFGGSRKMRHNELRTGVDVSFAASHEGKIYVRSPLTNKYPEHFKPLNYGN